MTSDEMRAVEPDTPDAILVAAIKQGQGPAFAEIYRRHAGPVYSRAWRILGGPGIAEDIAQEVFLRLWEHPERFDPDRGSLRTYLLVDTMGRCFDLARRDTRRGDREARAHRLEGRDQGDLDHELEDLLFADQVRGALETLSPAERQAIELAYFGQRSYRQVAILLGEPEGTVKSRIRSGLEKLRQQLGSPAWADRRYES